MRRKLNRDRKQYADTKESELTCYIYNKQRDEFEEIGIKICHPQVYILGPLLFFLIYGNKIPSVKQHGEIVSYTDDTTLYFMENP